jgi:2-keto-3-deoxy-L-rhamnonate aldolase RhmA
MTLVPRPSLRERLAGGETLVGTFLALGSPLAAEACGRAGLDWVLVDLEHGAECDPLPLLLGASAAGVHGLVRVAASERIRAGRALDLGAEGIMFPQVVSLEHARECAAALRHLPGGVRGVAGHHRGAGYGTEPDAVAAGDQRTVGIVQIENPEALEAAHEIAALDAVDVLFLGPTDLSFSMGIPRQIDHPDFRAAVERVVGAATDAGKTAGIMVSGAEGIEPAAADGFRFIAVGSDIGLLVAGVRAIAGAARA